MKFLQTIKVEEFKKILEAIPKIKIKEEIAVWKKEIFLDGSSEWVH